MSLKHIDYYTEARNELTKLESQGKISFYNIDGLRFKRIVEHIVKRRSTGETKREVYSISSIRTMQEANGYNWTRPEGVPRLEGDCVEQLLPYGFKINQSPDFKTLTREERNKKLDLPLDELRLEISIYLQKNYKLPHLSPLQMSDLADFFTKSFADTIYCEALWDERLVRSIASIVGERRYE